MPITYVEEIENEIVKESKDRREDRGKLCFFKFYNILNNKEKLRCFSQRIIKLLLEKEGKIIDDIIDNVEKFDNKFRFIYTQRHMGLTNVLCEIEESWKRKNPKNESSFIKMSSPKELLNKYLVDRLEDNRNKEENKLYRLESKYVNEIKEKLLESGKFSNNYQGKKLFLIDDMDVAFCELFYKNNFNLHSIYFMRKCFIKALVQLNKDKKANCSVIVGILTRLREIKKDDRDSLSHCLGISEDEKESMVIKLEEAWDGVDKFAIDAFFSQCQVGEDCTCSKKPAAQKNCGFAIDPHYEQILKMNQYKDEHRQQIYENVTYNIYEHCWDNNPWWLVLPLMHIYEKNRTCGTKSNGNNNIDNEIKKYYQARGDKRRLRGDLLEEFCFTYVLHCKKDRTRKSFLRIIKKRMGYIRKKLKNYDKEVPLKLKNWEKELVYSLEDSGAIKKPENRDKNDLYLIHPFIGYIYSRESIFNNKKGVDNDEY